MTDIFEESGSGSLQIEPLDLLHYCICHYHVSECAHLRVEYRAEQWSELGRDDAMQTVLTRRRESESPIRCTEVDKDDAGQDTTQQDVPCSYGSLEMPMMEASHPLCTRLANLQNEEEKIKDEKICGGSSRKKRERRWKCYD